MANLVFDLGGVVFNWQPLMLLRQVLPHHAPDDERARVLAQGLFQSFGLDSDWAAFDRGTADAPAVAQRIAARLGLQAEEVHGVIDAIHGHLVPLPQTLALMSALKSEGHRLFYLSNMPACYAAVLEQHDFFRWFDDGVFSCRVHLIKPELAIFQAAQERFRVQPSSTCFIDDVAHNVDAARRHGWQGVQFLDAIQCERALRESGILEADRLSSGAS